MSGQCKEFRQRLSVLVIFLLLGLNFVGTMNSARADMTDEYKRTFDRAIREYRNQNWLRALVLFKEANSIEASARTLRGMGLAAFQDDRYVDAIRWLTDALHHKKQPLTDEQRSKIRRVIVRATKKVGSYQLRVTPSEATITIDGREALIEDGRILLDPGEQHFVAKSSGFLDYKRDLTVSSGDNGLLRVALSPIADDENIPLTTLALSSGEDPENQTTIVDSNTNGEDHLLAWILVGTGTAFAATGGAFLVLSKNDIDKVKNAEGSVKEIEEAQKRVPVYSTVGFGLAAVGVASIGWGVAIFAFGNRSGFDDDTAQQSSLRVGPTGVSLSGRF